MDTTPKGNRLHIAIFGRTNVGKSSLLSMITRGTEAQVSVLALVGERGREWIARLPQEDFCQALGHPPSKKYEGDGGPGIAEGMRLLAGSSDDGDRESFA